MKNLSIVSVLLFTCNILCAQNITAENYINMYKNIAIAEMKRSGIPASVTLAQGILETESGNSDLVRRSNNHFGIKCKKSWTGETVTHTDDAPNECFRKYEKAEDSYKDHSDYLKTSARYATLFQLNSSDYKGWAYGLKKAGYATNPRYPQILISNIEKYSLQQYDNESLDVAENAAIINQNNIRESLKEKSTVPDQFSIENGLAGKTTFNGLKGLFVVKGTSLLAIATKADITLMKLLDYNDLVTDGLLNDDQWIYLEKKAKQGNRDIYTALQDETLYDISQNNGVQLKALMQFNNMSERESVKKGIRIKLRPSQQLTLAK